MADNAQPRMARAALLQRLRPGSIGVQFALIVVTSIAVATAVVATAAYTSSRRFALSEAQRRVDLAVLVEATRLGDVLVEKNRTVAKWSRLEVMRALAYGDVDKQIADFLARSLAGSPEDVAAACMDRSGALVASAGNPDAVAALVAAGETATGRLTVGGNQLLLFRARAVLEDSPGQQLGLVTLAVDPRLLLAGRSAGDSSAYQLTILDRDRQTLATSAGARRGPANASISAVAPLRWPDSAGDPVLLVEASEPAAQALAPARALQSRIVTAGLAVLLIASLAGAALAMRISRPIRLFTAAVERVRERERISGPLELPGGTGEIGVLSDAFARMAHTLTLAEERNVAQSRLALLGEVAANIAHEVRTPLSSLRSAGQMLAGEERDRETREKLGRLIVSEADRLHRVVSDLVQTARPPSGLRRPCDVSELVARAVATLTPLALAQKSEIFVVGPVTPIAVEADPDQIHQALLNVLRNALDAGGRGQHVVVTVRAADRSAGIEVRDGGPGFTASVLARPFAPFQTTKTGGTGLGLAIVRRIVEEHGGKVTLRNEETGGACVSVTLPCAPSDARASSYAGRVSRS